MASTRAIAVVGKLGAVCDEQAYVKRYDRASIVVEVEIPWDSALQCGLVYRDDSHHGAKTDMLPGQRCTLTLEVPNGG